MKCGTFLVAHFTLLWKKSSSYGGHVDVDGSVGIVAFDIAVC